MMRILLASGGASQGLVETEFLQAAMEAPVVVPITPFTIHIYCQQLNLRLQQQELRLVMLDSAIIFIFR